MIIKITMIIITIKIIMIIKIITIMLIKIKIIIFFLFLFFKLNNSFIEINRCVYTINQQKIKLYVFKLYNVTVGIF